MDLRNGSATKAKIRAVEDAVLTQEGGMVAGDLRRNKEVEAILQEVMNPGR
jgi:hypothetical protein